MPDNSEKFKKYTIRLVIIFIILILVYTIYYFIQNDIKINIIKTDGYGAIFNEYLGNISGALIWGPVLIILLVGTGIYLTIKLKGLQFTMLLHSLKLAFIKRKDTDSSSQGDITHFQALMTALAATVGVGNIAGVATAIAGGGPGALFWMWITGLVGMATKYSEAVLAVKYREKDEKGEMIGGPMFYIWKGLKSKWLGITFAIFAAIAAFGIGNMVQSNTVAQALEILDVDYWVTGLILFVLATLVIIGGIKSIGKVTSTIVPFMIILYVLSAIVILIIQYDTIWPSIKNIFGYAFSGQAAVGGFTGYAIKLAIEKGVSRGIFSNESGLGSSPIAAAAAKTKDPSTQALVSMTQTFIDTIIVCTMTGLVILSTPYWQGEYNLTGADLTSRAFHEAITVLPYSINGEMYNLGDIIVSICIAFFAFSTILGWSYYGEKAYEFLFKAKYIYVYRILFCIMVFLGSAIMTFTSDYTGLEIVWTFSDIMNGLMAFPNLIALLLLSGVVAYETKQYMMKNRK